MTREYFYRFFGLRVRTTIPFLSVAEADAGPIDVNIEFGSVEAAMRDSVFESIIPGYCRDLFRFVILDGQSIIIERLNPFSDEFLFQILQGELMSALLRQRGLLVLHACSVVKNGRATSFVGDSGWGKSTLAEYYCQNGYSLLTDDVLAVDTTPAVPIAYPSYPDIRLREEAGRFLRSDFESLDFVASETGRRTSNRSDLLRDSPADVGPIYVLQEHFGSETKCVPLDGRQKIMQLIRHTRSTNLTLTTDLMSNHLEQVRRLCDKVDVVGLMREKSLDSLGIIKQLTEGQ